MTEFHEFITKRAAEVDTLFCEAKFDEVVQYCTDDYIGMYPGQRLIKDKETYKSFLEKCYRNTPGKYVHEIIHVEQMGENHAYAIGIVKYYDDSGNIVQQLKDLVLWKKVDGQWLIHLDAVNSDSIQSKNVFDDSKLDA